MTLADLPHLNASLNAGAAILLLTGWGLVKSGRRDAHRAAMLGATACSAAFLACYLYYHFHAGSRRYEGPHRPFYLALLLSHTVLATAVLPVILRTLFLAWKGRFEEHRRWARWAFPVWLYVSATGVAVYWMLYRI